MMTFSTALQPTNRSCAVHHIPFGNILDKDTKQYENIDFFCYLCRVMRRLIAILTLLLGVFVFEKVDIKVADNNIECAISDSHQQQIKCCHRHNIDAERTSSIVVPTARTTSSNISRQEQQRISHFAFIGRFATNTKYPVTQFIHSLGSCARAVDFYLYILCRLRL